MYVNVVFVMFVQRSEFNSGQRIALYKNVFIFIIIIIVCFGQDLFQSLSTECAVIQYRACCHTVKSAPEDVHTAIYSTYTECSCIVTIFTKGLMYVFVCVCVCVCVLPVCMIEHVCVSCGCTGRCTPD